MWNQPALLQGRCAGQFEPFLRGMLRSVAAAIGCSYETISRDFSQSNYSSSRLSLIDDRENWKVLQNYLVDALCRPVYEAWMDAAVAGGLLPMPHYEAGRERYQRARWMCRGWSWVDPMKEVEAYNQAIRSGFTTLGQVIALQELGCDHAQLGVQLMKQWKLPLILENNILYHHKPSEAQQSVPATIVHLADIIVNSLGIGSSGEKIIPPLDYNAWENLELSPSSFETIIGQATHQFHALDQILHA